MGGGYVDVTVQEADLFARPVIDGFRLNITSDNHRLIHHVILRELDALDPALKPAGAGQYIDLASQQLGYGLIALAKAKHLDLDP